MFGEAFGLSPFRISYATGTDLLEDACQRIQRAAEALKAKCLASGVRVANPVLRRSLLLLKFELASGWRFGSFLPITLPVGFSWLKPTQA